MSDITQAGQVELVEVSTQAVWGARMTISCMPVTPQQRVCFLSVLDMLEVEKAGDTVLLRLVT